MRNQSYYHTHLEQKSYYGKHVMIDCKVCNQSITRLSIVEDFITDLVKKIDMIAHGDIIIDRFGEGEDAGISACQLITTSSITIHTNDEYRDFYLDVFSCKNFDESIIKDEITKIFNPLFMNINIMLRG